LPSAPGAAASADETAQMVLDGLDDGNPARYRNARRSSLGQEVLLEYEYDGGEPHEPPFFRV